MSDETLSYIIFLETTLASFYENIKSHPDLFRYIPVLEFMETHSRQHAEAIYDIKEKYQRPSATDKLLIETQNKITSDLQDEIHNERDYEKIFKKLASSEEDIGNLYLKICDFLTSLSDHYKTLSDEIKKIADEEFDHRDILLNDARRMAIKNEKKK